MNSAPEKLARMAGFAVPAGTSIPCAEVDGVGKQHPLSLVALKNVAAMMDGLSDSNGLVTRHREAAGWLYQPDSVPTPTDKLWGSSYLTQIHAQLTRKSWGLQPTASIGFCSGESNALFAMDAFAGEVFYGTVNQV